MEEDDEPWTRHSRYPDYYHCLRISQLTSADNIEKAWKAVARDIHPDKVESYVKTQTLRGQMKPEDSGCAEEHDGRVPAGV